LIPKEKKNYSKGALLHTGSDSKSFEAPAKTQSI
jgi:hypothetical protein